MAGDECEEAVVELVVAEYDGGAGAEDVFLVADEHVAARLALTKGA